MIVDIRDPSCSTCRTTISFVRVDIFPWEPVMKERGNTAEYCTAGEMKRTDVNLSMLMNNQLFLFALVHTIMCVKN